MRATSREQRLQVHGVLRVMHRSVVRGRAIDEMPPPLRDLIELAGSRIPALHRGMEYFTELAQFSVLLGTRLLSMLLFLKAYKNLGRKDPRKYIGAITLQAYNSIE